MKYGFHPEAEAEFFQAIDYYEGCELDLGYDFALEVHATIDNILSFLYAWAALEEDIRLCQIRRFLYGIIYFLHGDFIFILAVMHLHRDPEGWKDRG